MDNKLAVIGSELPVLQAKGTYKYLKEITGLVLVCHLYLQC